jgi:hypothetical protein
MSCGSHADDPVRPPADPEPAWNPRRPSAGSISGRSHLNWKGDTNAKSFFFQLFHTSGPDRSTPARLERQHQQPAHDERGLPARRAWAWRRSGADTPAAAVEQPAVQRVVLPGDPLAQFFQAPSTT